MRNLMRKKSLLGVILVLVVIGLWAFGLLGGPAVAY
jgi:hypothetical protein